MSNMARNRHDVESGTQAPRRGAYRSAISAGSRSTWWRQSLHHA